MTDSSEDNSKPRLTRGISQADFNLWKHHPVSKVVLQFLDDKRAFIERAAISQWIDGSLTLQADQTLRGQVIELLEMASLPFEAIESFYNQEEFDGSEAS